MGYLSLQILFSIIPVILAGCLNMIFVKIRILDVLKKPIDNGFYLKDGERLFGDNKTWKGFLGMIFFTSIFMLLLGLICINIKNLNKLSLFDFSSMIFPFEVMFYGAFWGLGYVLFELPNSFIKRRLKILPGKNAQGFKGKIFLLIDQLDSVIGCFVFMLIFHIPTLTEAVLFIILCTAVHYIINILLFFAKLKKQMG